MVKYTIDQIIDAGRISYSKHGDDFRMSDVAKELNTRASSLYRHVKTKRELYFAMLTKEFNDFEIIIQELIRKLENPTPQQILQSVGRYILKMARDNTEKFSLMFLTKPPDQGSKLEVSEEVGPFEEACNPQTIGFIHSLVLEHIKLHNIDKQKLTNITFFLISLVIGAGVVTSPTYEYSTQGLLQNDQYQKFHEFVIDNSLKLWSQ